MFKKDYVLITPAKNEEKFIVKTIESVISQSILPKKWIIVDDGSTDRTPEIVEQYAKKYPYIIIIKKEQKAKRSFSSKVDAITLAYDYLSEIIYNFIGNLDADISFERDYFEKLLKIFSLDENLGIGGGIICEMIKNKFVPLNISLDSVSGAVQLFRRECYEDIGGYMPLKYGGVDALAEIMAKMKGWKVQNFSDLKVNHYRRVGKGKSNILKAKFKQGKMFFKLGYHPLFQILRCIFRIIDKPFFIGSLASCLGYFYLLVKAENPEVPEQVIKYLRSYQKKRLKKLFIK